MDDRMYGILFISDSNTSISYVGPLRSNYQDVIRSAKALLVEMSMKDKRERERVETSRGNFQVIEAGLTSVKGKHLDRRSFVL